MFCDLVGSTEIAARLDPEDWHEIGAEYQRTAAEAVTRFGGHVAKYLGDGLVVYFGYPKAMEDAAERAVRAGLAMVEATTKLNEHFARHAVKLQVRVGIHTGSVVVAQGGGKEADMFGDAPNIASRVQSAAQPDTVVMTAATHTLVSGIFVVEDLGAHALKGIAEPMRLYRAAGAGVSRRRSFEGRAHTPFVGREEDMQLLARRWQSVRDDEGQLVIIMGEAGIGKSRLLDEFRARLKADPHLWIQCAGEELHGNTPFHAVAQMLDQGFGWRGDESKEERFAALERALQTAGLKLEEALPLIAELLDLPLSPDYAAVKFSPEQKRKRLFAAPVRLGLLGRHHPALGHRNRGYALGRSVHDRAFANAGRARRHDAVDAGRDGAARVSRAVAAQSASRADHAQPAQRPTDARDRRQCRRARRAARRCH